MMRNMVEISTDFAGGNACVLDLKPGDIPEIHFCSSPSGGPEAMWFYFRACVPRGSSAGIRCVMHFVENLLGGCASALVPVYKTEKAGWSRVLHTEINEKPDGQYAVSWKIPSDEGIVSVALCYPYGPDEMSVFLRESHPAFRQDFIGVTPGDNPILRLSNNPGEPGSKRPGVYCICRQHSGETPGSWMLEGFLRAMVDAGDASPLLWAVPFINPDGVIEGEYGKDSFPLDFNRAWGSGKFPDELKASMGVKAMRHEVKCVQEDMSRWQNRCSPALSLDFHAPVLKVSKGIYCYLRNLSSDCIPDEKHRPWVEGFRLALVDKGFAAEKFVRSGQYQSRWNTARVGDFVVEVMKIPHVTFEVPYARKGRFVFEIQDYLEAGAAVARTVLNLTRGRAP